MNIISCRRNFSDPDNLHASGHLFREINLSDDSTTRSFSDVSDYTLSIANESVLLLVHGYNNEQDEVYDAYSIIEDKIQSQMSGAYDRIVGYSWPGGDHRLEWWDAKSRANAVARRFRILLMKLAQSASTIDVMSHSLGARVVLKGLKQASLQTTNPVIRNYFCTAAAVDNEVFEPDEEFADCVAKIQATFVFHSKNDPVLSRAYRAAEWDRALGLSGPEDKEYIQNRARNVYVVNCKRKIHRHGGYKRSDAIFSYIARAMVQKPRRYKTL